MEISRGGRRQAEGANISTHVFDALSACRRSQRAIVTSSRDLRRHHAVQRGSGDGHTVGISRGGRGQAEGTNI